ncbi:MAG: class I SAM-dependent methyltransferase [Crocinitomicaceae bacterium]|jgi:phosphatidylethanolamine/phosphatidyl-N-methylethanolamine N-methyltransferase
MKTIISFMYQFFKGAQTVGSFFPSTPILASKIVKHIDFSKAKLIVEVGPGTGSFTKKIIKKLNKDAIFIAFELNEKFYHKLKNEMNDSRFVLINGSAEDLKEYLIHKGYLEVDYLISSIPLSNFKGKKIVTLLHSFRALIGEKGTFIQFQYSFNQKRLFHKMFSNVIMDFTQFNIPPAFIYVCKN